MAGFGGIFKHFPYPSGILLPSIVHARPPAGNANRWAIKRKSIIMKNMSKYQLLILFQYISIFLVLISIMILIFINSKYNHRIKQTLSQGPSNTYILTIPLPIRFIPTINGINVPSQPPRYIYGQEKLCYRLNGSEICNYILTIYTETPFPTPIPTITYTPTRSPTPQPTESSTPINYINNPTKNSQNLEKIINYCCIALLLFGLTSIIILSISRIKVKKKIK